MLKFDKEKTKSAIWEILDTVLFVVVAIIIIRFFLIELRWIPSGSMMPTLYGDKDHALTSDRIVVEKFSKDYNLITKGKYENTPKRGDVMIFYPPSVKLKTTPSAVFSRLTGIFCNETAYIKRVIGLPGERIEIKQNSDGATYVYINGKRLNEEYVMSEYDYTKCDNNMYCGPFIIPEGHYFMMGDNRGHSFDSRYWGTLPKERFIGRAIFVFWPLNHLQILN
ncbi:MAG: signal peptidase I [bacterium]|nr:signal peptidase I [bacterium]